MVKEHNSMKELHKIMEKLHSDRAGMTKEMIIRDITSGADAVKKKYNVNLLKKINMKKAANYL